MATRAPTAFTGWHMTAILVAFFGVVIAVNFYLAREAISTFGGEVVENSYVASQHYNHWLDEAAKEKALGWTAVARRAKDGSVHVTLTGVPAGATLSALARHPLGRVPDRAMAFAEAPDGSYVSRAPLPEGRWRVRLEIAANGSRWRSEEDL
ncbi:MAG: FixH family protein [Sphingomonadales bacterium]|nr:FixH family protein [Sphingomonadales bacterium]